MVFRCQIHAIRYGQCLLLHEQHFVWNLVLDNDPSGLKVLALNKFKSKPLLAVENKYHHHHYGILYLMIYEIFEMQYERYQVI